MSTNRALILISMLLVLTQAGISQDEPRSRASFALAVSADRVEFQPGMPIPLKLTITNTSVSDFHYSVAVVSCAPIINEWVKVRQVQIQLDDINRNQVPLSVYGSVAQRRPRAEGEQGFGCGGRSATEVLKPGESLTEEVDLSKEFDIKKPGKYTVRAERFDEKAKAMVKAEPVTLVISAAK